MNTKLTEIAADTFRINTFILEANLGFSQFLVHDDEPLLSSKNPAKGMTDGEEFSTGSHSFKFLATPHVPHNLEAGMLFDTSTGVLFSSDILHQNGDVAALTSDSVTDRVRQSMLEMQASPLADYLPYTPNTDATIKRIASLKPTTVASMHGSIYQGDGEKAILEYGAVLKEVFGSGH